VRVPALLADGRRPRHRAATDRAGDVLFIVGGRGGGYAALDARTGRELWSFPTDAFTLAPTIAVGNLIVTADYSGVVRVFGPPTLLGSR
jgi:outer membrane protein assembly factor BamB